MDSYFTDKIDELREEFKKVVNEIIELFESNGMGFNDDFIDELKKIEKEKEKLDEIGTKPIHEKVEDFTKAYFKQKFNVDIDPKILVEGIREYSERKRVLEKDKQEIHVLIAKLLILKLPREFKETMKSSQRKVIEEEIANFLISEIKRK